MHRPKLSLTGIWRLLMACALLLSQCSKPVPIPAGLQQYTAGTEGLTGRAAYLDSPFVTAGDRLYMVGHQNGRFPDLGWHVAGEMGGIWDHPIKLLDGFTASIQSAAGSICLTEADTFINYPFANKQIFSSLPGNLRVERFQFAPDSLEALVVEFKITNRSDQPQSLQFEFTGFSDLRPVWLGERTGMVDGPDYAEWDETAHSWIVKDSLNDWYAMLGSTLSGKSKPNPAIDCSYHPAGKGTTAAITYDLNLPPNGVALVPFTIAGSYQSREKLKAVFSEVQQHASGLLAAKKARYAALAAQTRLTIPDKQLQQTFEWLKYNDDWLVRDVPEIGRGLSAGLPDYPWWFGADNEYALKGLITTGRRDLVYSTIDLLVNISEKTNGNGRIVHEVSTNGAVFNPGNINETPQFASLIRAVYQWTGDRVFLEKYYPMVKKGLDWLMRENDRDLNLLPDGFGMMEIHGMNSEMVDVAAYTQKAFADAAAMARVMNEDSLAGVYDGLAGQLAAKINTEFWAPDYHSYADFVGNNWQALTLLQDALVRADTLHKPWAVEELTATRDKLLQSTAYYKKQGYVLYHNWVVNTPMETGVADPDKAVQALETGNRFVNPFGMFVTGIDRDETAGEDEGSFAQGKKIFSYTGAVMTLPTGVQAVAENNYGRPDQALDYLRRMTRSFGFALPGSIYEVSPDFGMMTQAWTIYSFAVPIVQQFFGIRP
ncbi:MAG TPA: hypothetical protein PKB07_27505, partial [Flavilitoribacter sp.]|nr:hypothetical protein [Flavilitoribacter sp.]